MIKLAQPKFKFGDLVMTAQGQYTFFVAKIYLRIDNNYVYADRSNTFGEWDEKDLEILPSEITFTCDWTYIDKLGGYVIPVPFQDDLKKFIGRRTRVTVEALEPGEK